MLHPYLNRKEKGKVISLPPLPPPQVLGCVIIGIGSWGIAVDSDLDFMTRSNIGSGAALLIVAGCLTVIICGLGIVGALFKWRYLLVTVSC